MRTLSTILCTVGMLAFLSLGAVLAAGILGELSGILSAMESGNLWAFAFNNMPWFGCAELVGLCLFGMGRLLARLAD